MSVKTNGTPNRGATEIGTDVKDESHIKVFVGTLVHSTRDAPMLILPDMALGVFGSKIQFLDEAGKLKEIQTQYGFPDSVVTLLSARQFVMPGMIDTHIHASQFPNNGLKLDLPLLEWLQKYTFPCESSFKDLKFAKEVYDRVVDRTLRHGTTTASYFATLHLAATKTLADSVTARGQRALVGKVNMVRNCPDHYKEASVEESIRETEELIGYVESLQNPLVSAIVTPRFAITCPEDQMARLGKVAATHSCHIQTHLSENKSEMALIRELFPSSRSYCEVYRDAGLLTNKTILAHCIWLDDEDLDIMAKAEVGVSHCPNSNLSLSSGHCNVRRLLNRGIKVALGTDCSGGYSASLLNALRFTLHVSKSITMQDPGNQFLSLKETFRLATLGGAQVLDMEDRIGNFEVGKDFDALVIDAEAPGTPLDIFDKDSTEDVIEKFLYNGDDRNITQVFVAGRCVVHH